jgi:hypothetical protein
LLAAILQSMADNFFGVTVSAGSVNKIDAAVQGAMDETSGFGHCRWDDAATVAALLVITGGNTIGHAQSHCA